LALIVFFVILKHRLALDSAFKVVDLIIWCHCSDHNILLLNHALNRLHLLSHNTGLSELPISFTVQLICPYEDSALLLRRVQEQAICGESLVLMNFQNIAHLHCRTRLHVPCATLLQVFVHCIIHIFVLPESLDVVKCLFDHRDRQHEHKWRNVCEHKTDLQWRVKLGHCDQQEKHIVEKLELVVENDRQESQNVVFRVILAISHEA